MAKTNFTKQTMKMIKFLKKNISFAKCKNIYIILILLALLVALYFVFKKYVIKREGMENCEDYFDIPLAKDATEGDHILVFDAGYESKFSPTGGERPVLEGSIVKGVTITSVADEDDGNGYKVNLDTPLVDMGSIEEYGGNKFHVITNNNTNQVSENELCKGFIHADWEKDPEAGKNYFYVNEKDASVLSAGMYLAEGYGVVMPPHVYKTYVDSDDGGVLKVVLCNGRNCENVVNGSASPDTPIITNTIPADTKIRFIKQPKNSAWTNTTIE